MADQGSPTPRRALGPLPDDRDEATSGGRFARGAAADDPSAVTGPGRFRRLAMSPSSPVSAGSPSSPASAADPLDVPATTPVPPPAPVLPDPEAALPPAAGRRFSASAEPSEFASAAPRRSAVSATSPASPLEPLPKATGPTPTRPGTKPATRSDRPTPPAEPAARPAEPSRDLPRSVATAPSAPVSFTPASGTGAVSLASTGVPPRTPATRPPLSPPTPSPGTQPAERTEPAGEPDPSRKGRLSRRWTRADKPAKPHKERGATSVPATAEGTPAAPHAKERSARPALIIIASVAAVALLVAAGVWLLTLRSVATSGGPVSPTTAPALDPLLTSADLGTLGGLTWVESTGTADAARPVCLPASGAGLPDVLRTVSRKTTATGSEVASVVQVMDTYADAAAATSAYTIRRTQAGTCKDDNAWIAGASSVTGLADASDAVRYVVQDQQDLFHTLLLSRTGRTVSLVDVTTTEAAVPVNDLAQVAKLALNRQCGGELGTCPGNVVTATVPPLPGEPSGWLVEADLPRITAGAGRWGATDPFTTLAIPGSQCEAIDLETVPGTDSAGQRTLLLADDTSAPTGFGVDMVSYVFGAADDATALAKKLVKNINNCPDRAPTATVADGPAIKGTAGSGAKISGSSFLITQKTETTTVVYRVAVVTVGTKVVYLLGNPSTDFDFSDEQWKAIAIRAGQRAMQAA